MQLKILALNQSKCHSNNKVRKSSTTGAKHNAAVLMDKLQITYFASSLKHVGEHIAGRANMVLGSFFLVSKPTGY